MKLNFKFDPSILLFIILLGILYKLFNDKYDPPKDGECSDDEELPNCIDKRYGRY